MLAKVKTAAVVGLDAQEVEVEVDILSGLPAVNIVSLPDTAVQEARERGHRPMLMPTNSVSGTTIGGWSLSIRYSLS
jgi:hypothetical protein